MKIATTTQEVQCFSKNIGDAIRLYEGTGFKYLDFSFYFMAEEGHPFMSDNWKDYIMEAKDAADSLGMKFVQAHAPSCPLLGENMERSIMATCRSIEACAMLGIKEMAIHSAIDDAFKYPGDKLAYFEANRPFFEALIPSMEKYDVNILLENTCLVNMGGRYFPITAEDLNDMIGFLGHKKFAAVWDTGHALIQGLDIHNELVSLGANLRALHIHDNFKNADFHLPLFVGGLDVDNLMQGIIDSGFGGYFTYEVLGLIKKKGDNTGGGKRLLDPPAAAVKAALRYNYEVAKSILEAYGMYDE
ncbi:MAG: sugar phosphate isomerase/epimerase [Ruminococcaceae bacterium]|nr:sugar phosphate isomerase/epimerase [Oscillospiraceae bacterium]